MEERNATMHRGVGISRTVTKEMGWEMVCKTIAFLPCPKLFLSLDSRQIHFPFCSIFYFVVAFPVLRYFYLSFHQHHFKENGKQNLSLSSTAFGVSLKDFL